MDKAAAALGAKSDQKRVQGKKPVVGKKAAGKPAAEKKPIERKPTSEEKKVLHKLKFLYSVNAKSFWTANFG